MTLTDHFTFDELTRSSTAERLGIDNTPPAEILPRLFGEVFDKLDSKADKSECAHYHGERRQ